MKGALTSAGYPRLHWPRWRYRRPHHLQDTVRLELDVPASMIVWLDAFDVFGQGVERTAIFFLTSRLQAEQEAQWNRGAHGGRPGAAAIRAKVEVFLREPVNCGPGARDAKTFKATIAEIHGDEP